MYVRAESVSNPGDTSKARAQLRCPHCRHDVVLEDVLTDDKTASSPNAEIVRYGWRRCPRDECKGLVAIIMTFSQPIEVRASWPAETIDFDATDLPAVVVEALDEAVRCHSAGCYRATALMVRRALELVCDLEDAKGPNLAGRIKALRTKVSLPTELLEALDDLRYLGNDAAHVELKSFDAVGKDEAEAALLIAKEILKGLYQMRALRAKLAALKKAEE
jgi:hypothetical protein